VKEVSKVARVIGSCRVARWLEASETHHPGFEGQYESLISFQPTSLDHFANFGVREFGGQTKFLVSRSPELRGAGKEIQTIGSKPWENRWIRTFMGYRVSGVRGLKEFLFDCEVAKCRASRARTNTWHIR
jgi:hypothetical protein